MIYVGSDNLVWILNLINNATVPATYVTTATVNVTVYDDTGATVTTFTMTYVGTNVTVNLTNGQTVTGIDGNYQGTLPYTANLVDGNNYQIAAVVSFGGGQRTFKGKFNAGYSTN